MFAKAQVQKYSESRDSPNYSMSVEACQVLKTEKLKRYYVF